jgi:hypothetical protein
MARPVRLRDHTVTIRAPRELVFQMTSSFGRGRIKGGGGESSRVLERSDDVVLAEFKTRAGPFTVTTLERVTLEPPGRLTFEHVSGPLRYAREEFAFREVPQGTELEHSGEFVWFATPLIGRLAGALLVKRPFERVLIGPVRIGRLLSPCIPA